ncbi:MAG: hypothetical protein LBL79_08855 [Prevotella sp.]|jgi:hypothetical protein|nr:hypothetical protein [Prevotella sp.]
MGTRTYVYRVSFKEPINGKTDYIFGSLAAIYDTFTPCQVGCKVQRLWNCRITDENPYVGRKCTISKEPLHRKKQENSKSLGL